MVGALEGLGAAVETERSGEAFFALEPAQMAHALPAAMRHSLDRRGRQAEKLLAKLLHLALETSALNDVVSGSNGSCSGSYLCTSAAGYDGPTGLGTPNGVSAFTG